MKFLSMRSAVLGTQNNCRIFHHCNLLTFSRYCEILQYLREKVCSEQRNKEEEKCVFETEKKKKVQ
jgi:hypothetical protein